MDKDQREALADGRAKEAWTATARRARYGAGGKLARGSLSREIYLDRGIEDREKELDVDRLTTSLAQSHFGKVYREPLPPAPPKQSYADELLAQCRQCEVESEKERAKRTASEQGPEVSSNAGILPWVPWPFSKSTDDEHAAEGTAAEDDFRPASSWWTTLTGSTSIHSRTKDLQDLEADYDGESGYAGSGVWGLSAVKHGSRHRERERRHREEEAKVRNAAFDVAEASASVPPSSIHAISEAASASASEEGSKRMMIEWEGFVKYAETKERGESNSVSSNVSSSSLTRAAPLVNTYVHTPTNALSHSQSCSKFSQSSTVMGICGSISQRSGKPFREPASTCLEHR